MPQDKDARGEDMVILEVHEKHGPFYNAIPHMPLGVAIVLFIFNIICPGLGTFFSALCCLCGCQTKLGKPAKALCLNLLAALVQMATCILIVGWVWSILWGMNFVSFASRKVNEPSKTPYYVRRQSSVLE